MYYEINIALNGRHFFATDRRSITNSSTLKRVFEVLDQKFPETEGYHLSVSFQPEVGYGCSDRETIRKQVSQDTIYDFFTKKI